MSNLGTRNDYWNIALGVQQVFGLDSAMTGVNVAKDVAHLFERTDNVFGYVDDCSDLSESGR